MILVWLEIILFVPIKNISNNSFNVNMIWMKLT